ncbi:MAG: serine/threonine-protein phosphatase [Myxococcales bacterium]|nr:serine/threonine-protein phosphatase [Myxococcales bacterium]
MTTDFRFREVLARHRLECVALTDVGVARDHNEDAFWVDEDFGAFVVCDGMGGHAAGDVASHIATKVIASTIVRTPSSGKTEPLRRAMERANEAVFTRSQIDPACKGMGTTGVGLRLEDDVFHICHCGDSRAYLFRQQQLTQLTRDHSLHNLYQERPDLRGTMGEAQSNMIVRALGLSLTCDVEHRSMPVDVGDIYLLCSDGLTDLVGDDHIANVMRRNRHLGDMGGRLVDMANDAGGRDNITVVLIAVR